VALSMTGFGAAEGDVVGRRVRVEIRTVNHRWFNLATRLPGEFAALETPLRDRLRRDFARGHVTVVVRWIGEAPVEISLDLTRAEAVIDALRELKRRFDLAGDVTVELVARQGDLVGPARRDTDAVATWSMLEPIVGEAAAACRRERAREGTELVTELGERLALIEAAAERVAARAPERLQREHQRLQANVAQLLNGRTVDPGRIAQELALSADRLDITEELVRLGAHLRAAREMLAGDGPVGKQLGFLAQEMGRETNTIGAKANDAAIAQEVVAMKGELERFREQLENLE
jgi:uncharacterized protein (TIGR00255 family)